MMQQEVLLITATHSRLFTASPPYAATGTESTTWYERCKALFPQLLNTLL